MRAWADHTPDPQRRADRLVRAAELKATTDAEPADLEPLLRGAVDAYPAHARAWQDLASLLWDAGRAGDALDAATRALEHVSDPRARAALSELRGRALERDGRTREAALAYREAVDSGQGGAHAALSAARLLRSLGDWQGAAELLARFAERAPSDSDRAGVARVLLQLGRLRAGPLEDLDSAIVVYRRALELDPELREAREALAELLTHRPDHRAEATTRHRELLRENPTRGSSLRALARLSGSEIDVGGLAILRALGLASSEERSAAPARLPFRAAPDPAFEQPAWEALRRLVQEAAPALADALGASRQTVAGPGEDTLTRFRNAAVAAEADLTAPALLPLGAREFEETLQVLIRVADEQETVTGDGHLVNALAEAVGRRQRRRLRRFLEGVTAAELEAIDFEAWRRELRALSHAVALDRTGGDLRSALCALLADHTAAEVSGLPPEADLTPWVKSCPAACGLLDRVVRAWAGGLLERRREGDTLA
jgi:tetratricopeptide (TPR) repeat protein